MLEKLLEIINTESGTLTTVGLAARLKASTNLVEMMLQDLAARGLIRTYGNQDLHSVCGSCALSSGCQKDTCASPAIWTSVNKSGPTQVF